MNYLGISIYNKIIDCFHYMDYLFIITENNILKSISLRLLFEKYLKSEDIQLNDALYAFLINNRSIESNDNYKNNYKNLSNRNIEFRIEESDFKTILDLGNINVLDFIVYGKKGLFACREGVFEVNLNNEIDSFYGAPKAKLHKIFDANSYKMIPRIGEVLLSTSRDGLFRGSYWYGSKIRVTDNPLFTNSLKASWVQTDILNYKSDNLFEVLQNEVVNTKIDNSLNFNLDDGLSEHKKISKFGTQAIQFDNTINDVINFSEIIYAFNSLKYLFTIYSNGEMKGFKIENRNYNDTSFTILENIDVSKLGKPLSAHIVSRGAVIEFYDSVYCVKDKNLILLHDNESVQIKSYSNSKNYQNLVTIITEDQLKIKCISPY